MTEVELMRQVAAGDAHATRRLTAEHYDAVYRVLRHLSGNRDDAEDLAQEVFLAARRSGLRFEGSATLRTWLTRIAVNAHARHARRERLRRLCHLPQPRRQSDADAALDAEWLLAGLAKVSEDHRVALILHDVHGFSVAEVASIVKSPEGTVKARLHYARKRLQQILVCPNEVDEP